MFVCLEDVEQIMLTHHSFWQYGAYVLDLCGIQYTYSLSVEFYFSELGHWHQYRVGRRMGLKSGFDHVQHSIALLCCTSLICFDELNKVDPIVNKCNALWCYPQLTFLY